MSASGRFPDGLRITSVSPWSPVACEADLPLPDRGRRRRHGVGGSHGYSFPVTDSSGGYSLWLNAGGSPLTLIVRVRPGRTVTRNFALALAGSC